MAHCLTDDLDLEACINIIRNVRQDLNYSWLIEGMTIAPTFTFVLKDQKGNIAQTYTLTPVDGLITLNADKDVFNGSIMTYSITPTTPTADNWIEIKGKITNRL